MVVAGGGIGGLAAALFSARRGHDVVVVERDAAPPDGSPDDDFAAWARPGVPQARHSHNFLGRACLVLDLEAPDLVAALIDRGALRVAVAVAGHGADAGEPAFSLLCRRLVFEGVLRRAAEREPGVTMLAGSASEGLVVDTAGPVPVCVGLRTGSGEVIEADVVVDAGGRRSAVPAWLEPCGAAVRERSQACGFHYLTRFYRLVEGAGFPSTAIPIVAALDYATVMAFPADNRTFSLTLAVSADDPNRGRLRDPGIFDRFLAAVPMTRPWVEVGEPITDVSLMARIENRWRRLTDAAGRPAVGGLVLVGDASLHTNPTFGRGVSLALAQAQRLADTVEQVDDDPVAFVAGFEAWTAAHLGVWYESQVAADRGGLERLAAGLRGEHLPPSDDPISRLIAGLFALAPTDPAVARALARVGHLLLTPSDLFADAEVVNKVGAYLDAHPVIDPPVPGPTRAQFVDLVKA
jgi:2-polyprenyl-6-methoxyphenol hydroxylase-like FAD-dependent oxidoreductase